MSNETKKEECCPACSKTEHTYKYGCEIYDRNSFPKSSPHIPTGDGKHIHQHIDHSKCSCGKECDCDKNEVPTGEDWEKDMEALRKEWSDTVAKLNDGALAMYSDLIAEWWISKQSSLLLSQEKQWKDEMEEKYSNYIAGGAGCCTECEIYLDYKDSYQCSDSDYKCHSLLSNNQEDK